MARVHCDNTLTSRLHVKFAHELDVSLARQSIPGHDTIPRFWRLQPCAKWQNVNARSPGSFARN